MPEPLNFLCIIADQMRGDHMGCAGNPVIRTPHLDRLAETGVNFTRAYCNNPLCMPSRATLFTGMTPRGHEVRTNGIPLDPRFPTIAGALSDAGWRTHSVGKLHMTNFNIPKGADINDLEPVQYAESRQMWRERRLQKMPVPYYGFQSVEIIIGHGPGVDGDYLYWLRARDPDGFARMQADAGVRTPHGAEQAWHMALPETLHYNTWVADRTIDFLDNHPAGEPFFAWCSFPDPHHPYCPPEPWASMYDPADVVMPSRREGELDDLPPFYRAVHEDGIWVSGRTKPSRMPDEQLREILALTYGMVSHVDHNIGRILDALQRRGLRKRTVVCFLSDHGDMMGDHWIINKGPFHMNGLLRMPFLWSCPGVFAEGIETSALVSYLDFAPTIMDLAGVPMPEGVVPPEPEPEDLPPALPGISFAPQLRGEAGSPQDSVIVENDEDYLKLRLRTIVTDRYKLTVYPGQEYGELFDLQQDPGELRNLWNDPGSRDLKRDLQVRLLERLIETDNRTPRRLTHA
ncbi:MAG TPA: sulfatase-like hydrolase/transferase [Armatimonadota bacterium]|nr:sulfatase-like hydrolase/transferase [Armatimonadota bacterium]